MADKISSFTEFLDFILTPSAPVILIGAAIVLLFPILLHYILIKSTPYTTLPSVLLLGPAGAGKTALLTLFERGDAPATTHTSQRPQTVELTASRDSKTAQSFRNHEDTSGTHTKFLLVDTPGHGKLRNYALGKLASITSGGSKSSKLKAIVFMVDAAAIGENEALAPTASYLYEVLLGLQKRAASSKSSKPPPPIPVLVAANKTDLFTALPGALVKSNLEAEITRIRSSRSKGLLDSGVGIDEVGSEEHDDWLGAYGTEKFTFDQLREFDVDVDVIAGNVTGSTTGPDRWWSWIAQRI
ncbi:signal recognition particle receptor beta subunit [Colletotrichum orchidophilum]|uniref:Signal recognition particle receptor subunit beta n=1 Tax=Colletotrichum orchidophilum TaxID=1209926 RepID=A0A1G4BAD0_9PEZI|nr:signal recognition particle receptor beta subunit [Colletotrichum orchidophilum]OHE98338.1 signal recognition particle receptor beta subunit [Colletotrichum orchidophilum]